LRKPGLWTGSSTLRFEDLVIKVRNRCLYSGDLDARLPENSRQSCPYNSCR